MKTDAELIGNVKMRLLEYSREGDARLYNHTIELCSRLEAANVRIKELEGCNEHLAKKAEMDHRDSLTANARVRELEGLVHWSEAERLRGLLRWCHGQMDTNWEVSPRVSLANVLMFNLWSRLGDAPEKKHIKAIVNPEAGGEK